MTSLALERVAKRYGRRDPWVLREIDVTLRPASMTVIGGGNGSGKSTLLRIIAGLSAPTAGAVRGRPARVAVVPDRFVPPARMTARSYLRHHGLMRGLSTCRVGRRADELAGQLAIRPGLDTVLQGFSKGNAQKIVLAQAFLAPVDLLVLDEAHTALDDAARQALGQLLAAAQADGTIVVLSDPNSRLDNRHATIYEIDAGHLRLRGSNAAGIVTIRLRARRATSPLPLRGLAKTITPVEDGLTAVVDPDCSDELLRVALQLGWSVVDVRRDPGQPS